MSMEQPLSVSVVDSDVCITRKYQTELLEAIKAFTGWEETKKSYPVNVEHSVYWGYDWSSNVILAERETDEYTFWGWITGKKKKKMIFKVEASINYRNGKGTRGMDACVFDENWESALLDTLTNFCEKNKITHLVLEKNYCS